MARRPDIRPDLSGADLGGANFSQANLGGADLHRAVLIQADLSRADFREAPLYGANLSGAKLIEANLRLLPVLTGLLKRAMASIKREMIRPRLRMLSRRM